MANKHILRKRSFIVLIILFMFLFISCTNTSMNETDDYAKNNESAGDTNNNNESKGDASMDNDKLILKNGIEVEIDETNLPKVEIEIQDTGKMVLTLYPQFAPKTVDNFIKLVKEGFYDGIKFHRIRKDFMIQGGDPQGTGSGGSADTIKGEFASNGFDTNIIKHSRGVISMARVGGMPDSASSQFFIMHADNFGLDGEYAAFGKLSTGYDVLDKIADTPVTFNPVNGEKSVPLNDVIIKSMKVIE